MIILLIILNFAISWFNAWSVGRGWAESKANGGWTRFMSWMGATMSACGFTWCYLIILAVGAYMLGYLDERHVQGMFSLGYLVIILPILGSGLAIMIDSWAYFWRRKSLGSGAVAGWNTFAQVFNTIEAARGIPKALEAVFDIFAPKKSDKKDGVAVMLVILLVVLAVAGGILTTYAIVRSTARKHVFNMRLDYELPKATARERRSAG